MKYVSLCLAMMFSFSGLGCMSFPYSGFIEENAKQLKLNYPEAYRSVELENRKMSYTAQDKTSSNKWVVFIHGSPGSAEAFAHLMKNVRLLDNFNLIAVDRHGYGKYDKGKVERSLKVQADQTHELLKKHIEGQNQSFNKADIIIVGHSYGGSVVLQMAANQPKVYRKLMFLASSVDPSLEETKWIQHVADSWALRWLVPSDLDVCNQEILALKESLLALEKGFPQINPHISIIHGENDKLVPVENVDYLDRVFAESVKKGRLEKVIIKNMNHFLPWAYPDLIVEQIYKLAAKSK